MNSVEVVARFLLSGVCHQWPSHSLHFGGLALPLCARCLGTFTGVVLGLGMLWALGEGRRSSLPSWPHGALQGMWVVWWALDGTNSLAEVALGHPLLYAPSNALRLVTGMGCGLAIGVVLYPIMQWVLWGAQDERRVLRHTWELPVLLGVGMSVVVVELRWQTVPRALMIMQSVGCVAAAMSLVNMALIVLVAHREGVGRRPRDLALFAALGFLLALAEVSAVGLLRLFVGGTAAAFG